MAAILPPWPMKCTLAGSLERTLQMKFGISEDDTITMANGEDLTSLNDLASGVDKLNVDVKGSSDVMVHFSHENQTAAYPITLPVAAILPPWPMKVTVAGSLERALEMKFGIPEGKELTTDLMKINELSKGKHEIDFVLESAPRPNTAYKLAMGAIHTSNPLFSTLSAY